MTNAPATINANASFGNTQRPTDADGARKDAPRDSGSNDAEKDAGDGTHDDDREPLQHDDGRDLALAHAHGAQDAELPAARPHGGDDAVAQRDRNQTAERQAERHPYRPQLRVTGELWWLCVREEATGVRAAQLGEGRTQRGHIGRLRFISDADEQAAVRTGRVGDRNHRCDGRRTIAQRKRAEPGGADRWKRCEPDDGHFARVLGRDDIDRVADRSPRGAQGGRTQHDLVRRLRRASVGERQVDSTELLVEAEREDSVTGDRQRAGRERCQLVDVIVVRDGLDCIVWDRAEVVDDRDIPVPPMRCRSFQHRLDAGCERKPAGEQRDAQRGAAGHAVNRS